MKNAFIFPGQGAQYVSMGRDFFDSFAIARETFEEADDLLKESLSSLIFNGPEETLTQTKNSQVAIFVVSMALLRVFQKELSDIKPSVCAGLSLGEYTALCASRRLSFEKTLFLVRERARLMNEACEKVPGTMAAVIGMDGESIQSTLRNFPGVWVANFNAPGQTVISGTKEGVEKAALLLREKGARRVIPLTVHGAFHSGLMQSAQDGLTPYIQEAPLQESSIEFVMNVPGGYVRSNEEIRRNLISQVTHSVRWEESVLAMKEAGIELFIEIGCGKTLTGLNKKIGIQHAISVEKIGDLELVHATT